MKERKWKDEIIAWATARVIENAIRAYVQWGDNIK